MKHHDQVASVAHVLGSLRSSRSAGVDYGQPMTKETHVYLMLREAIISGQLVPGAHLRVAEIAESLGTSPIPVRAALRTLDTDGLVEVKPHVGAFVTDVPIQDLLDIVRIRAVLEVEAMTSVVERIGTATLSELAMLCDEMDEASSDGDTRSYAQLNTKFHRTIYEVSSNKALINVLHTLELRSVRGQVAFTFTAGRMIRSNDEHRRIHAALAAGDLSTLRHEVEAHREATRIALSTTLK